MPETIPPTSAALVAAALALQEGRLVAFPTETVYGLGADATNDKAVAKIFAAKNRPQFNPLIVHIARSEHADEFAQLSNTAEELMLRFWPGPLTLILPRAPNSAVSLLCTAGLDTVALRCPSHPVARGLIEAAGIPVAAPSANRSGRISPTTAQHVVEELGDAQDLAIILAGGKSGIGVESTVLDLTGETPVLLRPGAVLREEIEETLMRKILTSSGNAAHPSAPGQLTSHYAPRAKVRLNIRQPDMNEAYLAFGTPPREVPQQFLNLSPNADLFEAAANLFSHLRTLDNNGATSIAVAPIPEVGLGIAINDRLQRAAAG